MTDFNNIYNKYFRDVYYFVLSLSHNETVAEEITQETFFNALKNIDKFKGNCKIKVWLFQIAKNLYFSYYNKQKRFDLGMYHRNKVRIVLKKYYLIRKRVFVFIRFYIT